MLVMLVLQEVIKDVVNSIQEVHVDIQQNEHPYGHIKL